MAKYSIGSDNKLIPMVTKIAISVEAPLIKAMQSGLSSLHSKSIRRIRAFRAVPVDNFQRPETSVWVVFSPMNAHKTLLTYFEGLARYQEQ